MPLQGKMLILCLAWHQTTRDSALTLWPGAECLVGLPKPRVHPDSATPPQGCAISSREVAQLDGNGGPTGAAWANTTLQQEDLGWDTLAVLHVTLDGGLPVGLGLVHPSVHAIQAGHTWRHLEATAAVTFVSTWTSSLCVCVRARVCPCTLTSHHTHPLAAEGCQSPAGCQPDLPLARGRSSCTRH